MGLDLVVEGCARPGHEAEWRRTVERAFAGDQAPAAEIARFGEISIPGYERIGAPRVGFDPAADAWIIDQQGADTPEAKAEVLKAFHGYYALRLVSCDGVPAYSHGGLYDGIDETSFRGSFLSACVDVLGKDLIERAWDHKLAEAAFEYGQALLTAASAAAAAGAPPASAKPKQGLLARMGLGRKAPEPIPFEEQLRIVEAAGRWFVFWGERGHPIRAWF